MLEEMKARREFNSLLVHEIEAFGRDLKAAVEEPCDAKEHETWIKGLSSLSRVLTRHLPEEEGIDDQVPMDVPLQVPQARQRLEDFAEIAGKIGG